MDAFVGKLVKHAHIKARNTLTVRCSVDNFFTRPEKSCNKNTCPFNDGYMCTSSLGCMVYEADPLNSNSDGDTNDIFKSFIE